MLRRVITGIHKEAKGQIVVEYGLIIAIIAIICIGIMLVSNGAGGDDSGNLTDPVKNSGS